MWYIRFIVNHHPEKLKNMYSVLVNRPMKDFVKRLQKEKMAELEFYYNRSIFERIFSNMLLYYIANMINL